MKYQAGIFYHASLMDEYRLIDYRDFNTKEEAEKWINKEMEKYYPKEEPDPENPISDLYDAQIQEIDL